MTKNGRLEATPITFDVVPLSVNLPSGTSIEGEPMFCHSPAKFRAIVFGQMELGRGGRSTDRR